MKQAPVILLLASLITLHACQHNDNIPKVSDIPVQVKMERFEQSFFAIDTNNIPAGLAATRSRYPGFYPDFMQNILGVSGTDSDTATLYVTRMFLREYRHSPLYAILEKRFNNVSGIEKEIRSGMQFATYYFPEYKTPRLISFVGTLDAPGIALTDDYIAIGLQQYAGRNFDGYLTKEAVQMYPFYISRRFEPEYIPANCMKAVVSDIFPDSSDGKPLLDQMIEKGKQWWVLDKFMPHTADSLKTGYTQQQLDWCNENEALIWSYIQKQDELYSVNPATIQTYIGEGPFTQGFSQELSPGNIGQWIGWRIVQKYAGKNPDMKIEEVMKLAPDKILAESKYKPK